MPCYSPLKGFLNLETGGIVFKRSSLAGKAREVACGQCLGCRTDRANAWAARIVHEGECWDENCFITLTYDEAPPGGSLVRQDFVKFMKRLRKEFGDRQIRYYMCGEYGEKYDRPHYHAIVFNLQFRDLQSFSVSESGELFYSETLERIWGKGFCTVGKLTFESARYCAGYVCKKITGARADDFYLRCDEDGVAFWLEPEYGTMSRGVRCARCKTLGYKKPGCLICTGGIGRSWYEEFKGDVFPSDEIPVPGSGVFKKVPRYYVSLLEQEDEEAFEQVKAVRKKYLLAHIDEFSPDRLRDKYKVHMAKNKLFTNRSYES